jgi:hypothetical protein
LLGAPRPQLTETTGIRFPNRRFWDDPLDFWHRILGVDPWKRQRDVILAVRDHPRVAVRSGHKVSKSNTAAGVSLNHYCGFEGSRVVMSSTTGRQVNAILWRELMMLRARAGRCLDCKLRDPHGPRPCPHSALIGGELGLRAQTGLHSDDGLFREVWGFTATEAEAVAGISGSDVIYVFDESSGIPDEVFEATEGNRAGGARLLLFGNPTKNEGEFYDAFHEKQKFYFTLTISSEESPNVVEGRDVIPGLATRAFIDEKREEWGEDSPLYTVRIKGRHALKEAGKIFSVHVIGEAEERWHDTPPEGRLYLGVDPAGASGTGDESAFAPRRGLKILELTTKLGLSREAHVVEILGILASHRLPRETPVVVLDREGDIGFDVMKLLQAYVEEHPDHFELVLVRSSDRAIRQPKVYDRARDELTANFEQWVRSGGAIPEDARLAGEMHAVEWEQQINGRLKVTRKKALKKKLGRSPDRYDACALSAWEPLSLQDDLPPSAQEIADRERTTDVDASPVSLGIDPYVGVDVWGPRR